MDSFISCVTTNGKSNTAKVLIHFSIPYFIRRPCDVGGGVSMFSKKNFVGFSAGN